MAFPPMDGGLRVFLGLRESIMIFGMGVKDFKLRLNMVEQY